MSVVEGRTLVTDLDRGCDVCIVGSGAGGSVLAAGLCARGLDVVMVEEGGYRTAKDFDLEERHAYTEMYQDRGLRTSADGAVIVLQGRTVGGGTTVNWTTCFRTPDETLAHWRDHHGLSDLTPEALRPHFEAVEERLGIAPWPEQLANANNQVLLRGARKLGYDVAPLRRNVRGCINTGYCGVGCAWDAKQSMIVDVPAGRAPARAHALLGRARRSHRDAPRPRGPRPVLGARRPRAHRCPSPHPSACRGDRGRRHQHPGPAPAERARAPRADRPPHVPPSDGGRDRPLPRSDRRMVGRAAVGRVAPLLPTRRGGRLLPRVPAAPARVVRDGTLRLRRGPARVHAEPPPRQRAHRIDGRRLARRRSGRRSCGSRATVGRASTTPSRRESFAP